MATGFIAGPYTISYGGSSLGSVEDGFMLDIVGHEGVDIRAENLADLVQDGVFRGANCSIGFVLAAHTSNITAIHAATWMATKYGGTFGAVTAAQMGRLWSNVQSDSTRLILTPVDATNSTATHTWTFPFAPLFNGQSVAYNLQARQRLIPFKFKCHSTSGTLFTVA